MDYLQEELPSTLVNLVQPIDMGFYLDAMQRPVACRLASKGNELNLDKLYLYRVTIQNGKNLLLTRVS